MVNVAPIITRNGAMVNVAPISYPVASVVTVCPPDSMAFLVDTCRQTTPTLGKRRHPPLRFSPTVSNLATPRPGQQQNLETQLRRGTFPGALELNKRSPDLEVIPELR